MSRSIRGRRRTGCPARESRTTKCTSTSNIDCSSARTRPAAKAGISERSARRIERSEALPSQREARAWRTREDPLAAVWETEVVPLLEADAVAQRGDAAGGTAAPLSRRSTARECCARCSVACASGAPCTAPSARSSSRRSTRRGGWGCRTSPSPTSSGVQIAGAPFPHRLYQFALAHSGWRHVEVVEGGESFIALSTGLQSALWRLGGVPEEHRTDSLSAAFNNLAEQRSSRGATTGCASTTACERAAATRASRTRTASIESRHDSLKTALDQALRLRGSRCFDERADYEALGRARSCQAERPRGEAPGRCERAVLRALAGAAHRRVRGGAGAGEQVRASFTVRRRPVQRAEPDSSGSG